MPSVTVNKYDRYSLALAEGNGVNMEAPGGNGIKVAIVTVSYSPNQNTHEFWSDITGEVTGTNYTAGGNVLANGIATLSGAGLVTVDFDDPAAWSQSGTGFSNGRRFIIYHDTGVAGTSRLIGYSNDFGADQGNTTNDFTMTLDSAGLLQFPR